ncbi:MAG TPA: dicarboxylate/amino acid:cation symporter [Thermoanaerobaculia bacterium]|nr:dicarboxylate/amino acid:cation symporter [Thermoanaerobaculia bacterium]
MDGTEAGRRRPWYRKLHWQILIAMAAGVAVGAVGGEGAAERFGWLGTLFIRALKMVIVPLVLTSIISGVASVGGGRTFGRLFGKTLGYYVATSLLAILLGLALTNLIRPGAGLDLSRARQEALPEDLETPQSVVDLLLDLVPENVVVAASKPDMLALIFFSILFGIALGSLAEERRAPVVRFFEGAFETMMKLTGLVLAVAPLGVFGLMTRAVATFGLDAFRAMALYMVTIAIGLTLHLGVTLPAMLRIFGGIRPSIHFRNVAEPLAVAFSTSSSAATLPVTLSAVERRVGVSNRVTSFVLPMGATVNMDGTALYECAGVLFIAQALGFELSIAQQAVVVLTALLASIGAAAVPSAGLVIIFIVLEAVGLRGPQVEALVGFMLAVDRPLDMYRTAVNVASDTCGAAIIARSEGESEVDAAVIA